MDPTIPQAFTTVLILVIGINWMGAIFRSRLVQSLCPTSGRVSRADFILSGLATLTIAVTVAFILVGGSFPNLSPWPSVVFVSLGLLILEVVFVVLEVSDFRKLSRNSQILTEWLDGDKCTRLTLVLEKAIYRNALRFSLLASGCMSPAVVINRADYIGQTKGQQMADALAPTVGGLIVGSTFTVVVLHYIAKWISPANSLIWLCASVPDSPHPRKSNSNFKAARWRSPSHQQAFRIAKYVDRNLQGVRRRLTHDQFEVVESAYRKLAHLIKTLSLSAEYNTGTYLRFRVLTWMTLTLVANDDPVRAARRINTVLHHEPEAPVRKNSLVIRMLDALNGQLQSYSRLLQVILIVLFLLYLAASGQLNTTLDSINKLLIH